MKKIAVMISIFSLTFFPMNAHAQTRTQPRPTTTTTTTTTTTRQPRGIRNTKIRGSIRNIRENGQAVQETTYGVGVTTEFPRLGGGKVNLDIRNNGVSGEIEFTIP